MIDIGRDAIRTCLMIGGPILFVSLLIGIGIGVLQTMTQVQDQTVSFVPKLIGIVLSIGLSLPWLAAKMVDYTEESLATPVTHRYVNAGRDSYTQAPNLKTADDQSGLEEAKNLEPDPTPFRLPHYRFSRLPKSDQEL